MIDSSLIADPKWLFTTVLTTISIVAVVFPLTRGGILCWHARAATHPHRASNNRAAADAMSVRSALRKVYDEAVQENTASHPAVFLRDAAKQLVITKFESRFTNPISMYANILPPIGFIGTTAGLAVLLVSMEQSSTPLQLAALALALSSTIVSLIGYALLEGFKINVYRRLVRCLENDSHLFPSPTNAAPAPTN